MEPIQNEIHRLRSNGAAPRDGERPADSVGSECFGDGAAQPGDSEPAQRDVHYLRDRQLLQGGREEHLPLGRLRSDEQRWQL